jgi:hypothetical protein
MNSYKVKSLDDTNAIRSPQSTVCDRLYFQMTQKTFYEFISFRTFKKEWRKEL